MYIHIVAVRDGNDTPPPADPRADARGRIYIYIYIYTYIHMCIYTLIIIVVTSKLPHCRSACLSKPEYLAFVVVRTM